MLFTFYLTISPGFNVQLFRSLVVAYYLLYIMYFCTSDVIPKLTIAL